MLFVYVGLCLWMLKTFQDAIANETTDVNFCALLVKLKKGERICTQASVVNE